jgi:O-methyltransferase domain/Dimerisation domain
MASRIPGRAPDGRSSGTSLAQEGRSHHGETSERAAQTDAASPDRILELSYAFWKSKVLLSAVELDVFTVLAEGSLDIQELAARLGLHGRGARDFFDALVALDLLQRDTNGRYSNRPDTALHLDRRKPTYLGGLLEHLSARHYLNWSQLTEALRTGMPQSGALATGSYPALYADTTAQDIFLNGMSAGSLVSAKVLAKKFPWKNYSTIIDIGTAQGCVPVEIASVHPHLTGGGFDLPSVEPAFSSYVHKFGLSDRLRFYPGDFFADPLPESDVLVMGRILHNWDLPTRKLLLEKACRALPKRGALIVYDPLIDDARCVEAHGLLSSLNMLIETKGGSEYTGAECMNWLQQAGFRETYVEPLGDVHTAVIGFKSDG